MHVGLSLSDELTNAKVANAAGKWAGSTLFTRPLIGQPPRSSGTLRTILNNRLHIHMCM